jgi:hypothetical protein
MMDKEVGAACPTMDQEEGAACLMMDQEEAAACPTMDQEEGAACLMMDQEEEEKFWKTQKLTLKRDLEVEEMKQLRLVLVVVGA